MVGGGFVAARDFDQRGFSERLAEKLDAERHAVGSKKSAWNNDGG